MPRLIAFGCSNTFGSFLDKDDLYGESKNPSLDAWPNLLGSLMVRDAVNLGEPGVSNKKIWYNIMNYHYHKDDIVFILWTFKHRWCVLDKKNVTKNINWDHQSHDMNEKIYGPLPQYYKYFHTEFDDNIDFSLRLDHCTQFLNHKGIKHYHALTESKQGLATWITSDLPILLENVNNTILTKNDFALDGKHPGRLGHKVLAKALWRQQSNRKKLWYEYGTNNERKQ